MLALDRYIELVKKYGLEISQPALAPDRGLTWQMTKRRGDVEVHKYVFILYLVNELCLFIHNYELWIMLEPLFVISIYVFEKHIDDLK